MEELLIIQSVLSTWRDARTVSEAVATTPTCCVLLSATHPFLLGWTRIVDVHIYASLDIHGQPLGAPLLPLSPLLAHSQKSRQSPEATLTPPTGESGSFDLVCLCVLVLVPILVLVPNGGTLELDCTVPVCHLLLLQSTLAVVFGLHVWQDSPASASG